MRRYWLWIVAAVTMLIAVVVLLQSLSVPSIDVTSLGGTLLTGGIAGAVVSFIVLIVGQYLTGRRHSQALEHASALETQRAIKAAELEAQRAHDAALQKYFEQVGRLLIEQPLRRAAPGDNLSTVARAQTLAVLEGLDPTRKRLLLLFLYESGLISRDKLVISLRGASLSEVDLSGANLHAAKLSRADLSRANLSGATLRMADLSEANLRGTKLLQAELREANLSRTDLSRADLRGASLRGADLHKADLGGADISGAGMLRANLSEANLGGAKLLRAELREANLTRASLFTSNLSGADLRMANLSEANLNGANLSGASLRVANLSEANLSAAIGVTAQELERMAKSLEGATMPDGSKYE
jgi:uncharacterized protein YjbI with pentapeptide repeats